MKDASITIPGWILFWWLLIGQCIPAIHYDWGVQMGTQDPPEIVTEVGVAFWKGFAMADLIFYVPLLGIALWTEKNIYLAAAFGVTIYWPMVCLVTTLKAHDAPGWSLNVDVFLILLPLIILWGIWGLYRLDSSSSSSCRQQQVPHMECDEPERHHDGCCSSAEETQSLLQPAATTAVMVHGQDS